MVGYESSLAKNYQKIGKFKDSVAVYKYLLKRYPTDKKNIVWLQELLETHLASGARKSIASDLARYYPVVKERVSYSSEEWDKFQDSLGKVILTVHREARKTDDMAIWVAVDQLYKEYRKHFSTSTKGEIWYFWCSKTREAEKKMGRC